MSLERDVPFDPDFHYRRIATLATSHVGVVYLAEEKESKRQVALNVIWDGVISRKALGRFELEAGILGRLHHPHIAQLYASGRYTPHLHGRTLIMPYFALEYVPGALPLTKYADATHLDVRDRIRLFLELADTVQYAHQKGVIHRCLNPWSILVDGSGRVKIMYFGIARTTDHDLTLTTQKDVGALMATLPYWSPEQCTTTGLELDTRSDIYSLGVVLYELLAGQLPYQLTTSSLQTAARIICREPPARLSTLNRKLGGDLETIVLRALEKEREKRYDSVATLLHDVDKYLRGESVAAHPPPSRVRLARWVSRVDYVTDAAWEWNIPMSRRELAHLLKRETFSFVLDTVHGQLSCGNVSMEMARLDQPGSDAIALLNCIFDSMSTRMYSRCALFVDGGQALRSRVARLKKWLNDNCAGLGNVLVLTANKKGVAPVPRRWSGCRIRSY